MTLPRTQPRVVLRWVPKGGAGWQPIVHLVGLISRLFGAEIEEIGADRLSPLRRVTRSILPAKASGEDVVIYLVPHPQHIPVVVGDPDFGRPASQRVLWIVDSFWTEYVPEGLLRNFDRVIYMQTSESRFYDRVCAGPTLCAPWGADVLGLGGAGPERDIDVLRIGRQPPEWDDDDRTNEAARAAGLRFHGRPPVECPYASLMGMYRRSRYLVAFSNLVAPAPHTHPAKAYFTGRWTDALANGAVLGGIHPLEDEGVRDLLWDGALLTFDRVDLEENLARLARAAGEWTPDLALHNHVQALLKLDWRWRLDAVARWLGLSFPALVADLESLVERAERLRP